VLELAENLTPEMYELILGIMNKCCDSRSSKQVEEMFRWEVLEYYRLRRGTRWRSSRCARVSRHSVVERKHVETLEEALKMRKRRRCRTDSRESRPHKWLRNYLV
jgi:hypothetical protein